MGISKTFEATLSGKKSYIVALAAVVFAIAGWYTGNLTPEQAIQAVLAALGLASLRAGVKQETKPC